MSIDLAKLAAQLHQTATEHIDSDRPARDARAALVAALATITAAYRDAGIEQVSRYDLSDLMHAVGDLGVA